MSSYHEHAITPSLGHYEHTKGDWVVPQTSLTPMRFPDIKTSKSYSRRAIDARYDVRSRAYERHTHSKLGWTPMSRDMHDGAKRAPDGYERKPHNELDVTMAHTLSVGRRQDPTKPNRFGYTKTPYGYVH